MKILYIVRGMPGSGKSTFAQTLGLPHFEADDFFTDLDGSYNFDPNLLKKAHKFCQNNVRQCLSEGLSVVVANTFTTLKEIKPYIKMAEEYDAEVIVATCTGDYGSIHGIPESTLERMKARFVDHDTVLNVYGLENEQVA
jgi:predicted kinase